MKCASPISEPKNMDVSITNSGDSAKTFRVFKGETGVAEVDDNTSIVGTPFLDGVVNLADSLSNTLFPVISEEFNKAFFIASAQRVAVINTDDNSLITFIDTTGSSFTGATPMYYYNGFVYIVGQGVGRIVTIINASDLSFVNIHIAGSGTLRFGDIDKTNNRFFVTSFGDNKLWYIDTISNTLISFVNLSAYGGGTSLLNVKKGSDKIIVSIGQAAVIIDANLLTVLALVNTTAATIGDIGYASGKFGFADVIGGQGNVSFINETSFALSNVILNNTNSFFSKNAKQDRFVYIYNFNLSKVIEIDFLLESARDIVTSSAVGSILPIYSPTINSVICFDGISNNVMFIDLSDLSVKEVLLTPTSSLVRSGVASILTAKSFYPSQFSGDSVYVVNADESPEVSVVYNSGLSTTDQIDRMLNSNPIEVLAMKIKSSSLPELLNLLSKFDQNSAGTVNSFPLQNTVKYDANSRQYIVDYVGNDLANPIFDGNTYLQGTIDAMSSLSITLQYVEYNPSLTLAIDCDTDPIKAPPIQKKVCIFYNRKLF